MDLFLLDRLFFLVAQSFDLLNEFGIYLLIVPRSGLARLRSVRVVTEDMDCASLDLTSICPCESIGIHEDSQSRLKNLHALIGLQSCGLRP